MSNVILRFFDLSCIRIVAHASIVTVPPCYFVHKRWFHWNDFANDPTVKIKYVWNLNNFPLFDGNVIEEVNYILHEIPVLLSETLC